MGQLCPKCDHWVTRPELHEPEICAAGAYAHEHPTDPPVSPTFPQLVNNGPAGAGLLALAVPIP